MAKYLSYLELQSTDSVPTPLSILDTFFFATFTGLAFSDLKGLKPEHLAVDNNGSIEIRKKRQKTKNMCNIPLLEAPQQIFEKYKDHPSCVKNGTLLPVISNVKIIE